MESLQKLAAHKRSVQPHALVFPFPSLSHINPLLYVSQVLASTYGFRITFLSTHYRVIQLKQRRKKDDEEHLINFEVVPASIDISADDHQGVDAVPRFFQFFRSISESGAFEHWLQELHEKKGHPLSCIISDNLLSWTQPLADKLSIPRAAFWASTALSYVLFSHAPLLNHPSTHAHLTYEGQGNEVGEDDFTIPIKVPGICNKLPASTLPVQKEMSYTFSNMEMDKNCTWLMINTSNHIDNEPLQSIKVSLPNTKVLPIFHFSKESCLSSSNTQSCNENLNSNVTYPSQIFSNKENASCLDWLGSKPTSSVIYIAFGSIVLLEREKIQDIALALENSKKNFLWVLRSTKNNIQDDKCIKDGSIFPKGFVERTNEQGLIISWAPQLQVLAHPSVGCFLTHCGWNSVMESLSCGVPLLGIPPLAFADFKIVGWYIEHVWHVGLYLTIEKLNKVEFEKALEMLMGENIATTNVYRENAICISKALKLTTLGEELKLFAEEVIKRAHSTIVNY